MSWLGAGSMAGETFVRFVVKVVERRTNKGSGRKQVSVPYTGFGGSIGCRRYDKLEEERTRSSRCQGASHLQI